MTKSNHRAKSKPKPMPILARHGVSLALVFVLGLVLSYFAGQIINQRIQLGKLTNADQATFNEGLAYVVKHAGESESVTDHALDQVNNLPDAARAADLLLAIIQSHARIEQPTDPIIPDRVTDAIAPLMQRLEPMQAIGLYDGLIQIQGVNPIHAAESLLKSLTPKDDAELLRLVDLLDTRLLWSRQWAPLDLWVHWLSVLAKSDAELTQFNTAKRIGELPEAVDDQRVAESLAILSKSKHDTVRAAVLNACAGYAAMAKDPTDYEQIIFDLGNDSNKVIARRAWMIVGHLNPFSGFAVDWKDADPLVAEAMLWAAVKTNPENPKPAVDALKSAVPRIAWLAMGETDTIPYFQLVLDEGVESPVSQYSDGKPDFIAAWRAILGSTRFAGDHEYWYVTLHSIYEDKPSPLWTDEQKQQSHDTFLNRYLAVTYRFNEYHPPKARGLTELEAALAELAAVEGWATDLYRPNPFRVPKTPFAKLVTAATGIHPIHLRSLPEVIDFSLTPNAQLMAIALSHNLSDPNESVVDLWLRSGSTPLRTVAILGAGLRGDSYRIVQGVTAKLLREREDLTNSEIRAMSDDELAALGLQRIDAMPALLEAAESAPPSANRSVEAKLLRLALWMRGDLGDDFTPTAEAMLFDKELPTSMVLMCLLHMQRPVALDYLFADLVTPRPDLHKLFIQERYWHVFRRFVDTTDLTLWLWGDPEAQAFQLEAMQQWYAVNRWKIADGWWPELQE